jgi:hypothetical protein
MGMSVENWRAVVGFEGLYEVSDLGHVRSLNRIVNSFPGLTRVAQGRLMRLQPRRSGHLCVGLCRDGRRRLVNVHRLVLEAFVGPCPDGMECCHNDGDATNNRVENLRWDTRSENFLDRGRHGTHHNTRKTECPEGHPYNDFRQGKRRCKICSNAQQRARDARKRAAKR